MRGIIALLAAIAICLAIVTLLMPHVSSTAATSHSKISTVAVDEVTTRVAERVVPMSAGEIIARVELRRALRMAGHSLAAPVSNTTTETYHEVVRVRSGGL